MGSLIRGQNHRTIQLDTFNVKVGLRRNGWQVASSKPNVHPPCLVRNAHFSYVEPEPSPGAFLIASSENSAKLLDLNLPAILRNPDSRHDFVQVNSGNTLLEGTNPWAHVYAGYQFGFFAGQYVLLDFERAT